MHCMSIDKHVGSSVVSEETSEWLVFHSVSNMGSLQ